MKLDEIISTFEQALNNALKDPSYSIPQEFTNAFKASNNLHLLQEDKTARYYPNGLFIANARQVIKKLKDIKSTTPDSNNLGMENGKLYDVRIKTAQEEADRALKSVKDEIDKTPVSDRQKLEQLDVRYRSLGTAKKQLGELNEQFSTNPSALNPAELRRVTESVKEFASNPKLTSADQVSYSQAASAETPTTASGIKPTSASMLRPQDTRGASKPATVSGVGQAAVPTSAPSPASGNVPTPASGGAQAASAETPFDWGNLNVSEALPTKLKNYPELIKRETTRLNQVRTNLEAAKKEAALKRAESDKLKVSQAARKPDTSFLGSTFASMNNLLGLKSDVEREAEAAEEKVKQYERDIQTIPTEIERLRKRESADKEALKRYEESTTKNEREIQSLLKTAKESPTDPLVKVLDPATLSKIREKSKELHNAYRFLGKPEEAARVYNQIKEYENQPSSIQQQSPEMAASENIANQRAAQPGLGTFTASKDDTVLEALPPNLLIKLYDSLNQPHVDYGKGLVPNMSQAEINGIKKLNDLVNQGDPESIALLNELKQNQPEVFNTFQNVRSILQDTKLSPEDKEKFLRSSAELTGQGSSPVTAQDTQPYDKSMEVLRERLRNRIFEDFKKNDLRKFQDMFTGNQAYFGSRRKEIEKDLMQSLQEKLADVDASLGVQGEQKAYDRALADKMRKLQGASQFGGLNAQTANTALASNAQDIARAQALNASSLAERQQELMRQNLRKALAHDSTLTGLRANEAMMQAGGVQRKNQEEINKDKYRQFMDKVNHQRNSASAMLDAARGFQMAPTNMPMMNAATVNSNLMASAQPQQVYNASNNGMFGAAANLMGSLDKALNPQNLPRFKSGGVVKRPTYAVGGSVADDIMRQKRALIAKQMAQPPVDPYQQFMGNAQDVSNQLMNRAQNPGSPSGAFLRDYGANLMAADPNKTATQQVGEALKSGHAAYDNAEGQPMRDYESALKVQQVMHNTKKAVDEFKANQAIKKEELSLKREDQNLKRATMAAMMGYGSGDPALAEYDAKGKLTPRAKTLAKLDEKTLLEARAQVNTSQSLLVQLEALKEIIKNVKSGPWVARASKISPYFGQILGGGKSDDIASFDALAKSVVGSVEKMDPSRPLASRLKLLEESKMSVHLPQEANMKLLNELTYLKQMIMNRAMFVQDAYDKGIHTSKAEHAYNNYIEAVFDGDEDVTPMDFLEDVDENIKSKLKFNKMETFTSKLKNKEFFTEDELKNISNQTKKKKSKFQDKTPVNDEPSDNEINIPEETILKFMKMYNVSREDAIKELVEAKRK